MKLAVAPVSQRTRTFLPPKTPVIINELEEEESPISSMSQIAGTHLPEISHVEVVWVTGFFSTKELFAI